MVIGWRSIRLGAYNSEGVASSEVSFQDELRLLLKRYEMAFDERYVWD